MMFMRLSSSTCFRQLGQLASRTRLPARRPKSSGRLPRSFRWPILVMLLLFPALAPTVAVAGSPNSVSVQPIALLALQPASVSVGLRVQCVGAGFGFVSVQVHQDSPPATLPSGADGLGGTDVVCDGQQRQVAVTLGGDPGFNLGDAYATATLTVGSATATDARAIKIVLR
jgi:hypothetical protein